MRHVKIGHGRDYDDVQPLRGVFAGSGKPLVDPHVEIRRLHSAPAQPPPDPAHPRVRRSRPSSNSSSPDPGGRLAAGRIDRRILIDHGGGSHG